MLSIVLTGGPCAGKSSIMAALRKRLAGCPQFVCVDEVATILLRKRKYELSVKEGRLALQRDIFNYQQRAENLFAKTGRVLLLDRGILDGAAYWPTGLADWLSFFNCEEDECLKRYYMVIHLESLAFGKSYELNDVRSESAEEACKLDQKLEALWRHHPRRYILSHKLSLEEKTSAISSHVLFAIRKMAETQGQSVAANPSRVIDWTRLLAAA